ncbi:MAG: hypothetical protein V4505_17600 [Pseudomonadota bacterium]
MYLVVIAWLYVTLMMAVAEATSSTGSLLGALVTFVLYGVLPLMLVVYLFGTPLRRKALRAREAAERRQAAAALSAAAATATATSGEPDAGGHAPGAAEPPGIAPVREEK